MNMKVERFKNLSFPNEKTDKSLLKNFNENEERKSVEKDLTKLLISVIRTLIDLLLPLHYLGIRKMSTKSLGLFGTISSLGSML
mmetsp:Transcript_28215/g.28009  ORF Transcript_28215/g.28009 Transcript_28215/m.28009 type:complete len:84 (+) Transcript_28215:629-880(+)